MSNEHILYEPRCLICQLEFRSVIDNLLKQDSVSFDRTYSYLTALCREKGVKVPSRASLQRHKLRHILTPINIESLALDEHIIPISAICDALMYAIDPLVNEIDYPSIYHAWMNYDIKHSLWTYEKFYKKIKTVLDIAQVEQNKKEQALNSFKKYLEDKYSELKGVEIK